MLFALPKKFLLLIIHFYQKILSLDHSALKILRPQGQCKFYPTCSEYAYQAVEKYGVLKGCYLALKRVLKCHPWAEGGIKHLQ